MEIEVGVDNVCIYSHEPSCDVAVFGILSLGFIVVKRNEINYNGEKQRESTTDIHGWRNDDGEILCGNGAAV